MGFLFDAAESAVHLAVLCHLPSNRLCLAKMFFSPFGKHTHKIIGLNICIIKIYITNKTTNKQVKLKIIIIIQGLYSYMYLDYSFIR